LAGCVIIFLIFYRPQLNGRTGAFYIEFARMKKKLWRFGVFNMQVFLLPDVVEVCIGEAAVL
jgi:hypothetical protein